MIPFYIYYSMFGFQRIGDLAWAAGDMQARGFLLGGTSGRTTLNGEGLQHEDGHSHILAGTIPNCISYDPTFAHEVAVILHHGLKRMVERRKTSSTYITLLNENYAHAGPEGHRGADHQGHVPAARKARRGRRASTCWAAARSCANHRRRRPAGRRLGRGGRRLELPELQRAGATARTPSAGTCCTRWKAARAVRRAQLEATAGPVVAATDYMKNYAEQIRPSSPEGPHLPTRCWAPTASAAATPASCATISRSTATG